MLRCVKCHNDLIKLNSEYFCNTCKRSYPSKNGIFVFLTDAYDENFFPEETFNELYNLEAANFWFKVRNLIVGNFIQKYASNNSKIVEFGCGTGFVSSYLRTLGYDLDCADMSIQGLNYCKSRGSGSNYYQFNLYDPLFYDHYDCICAFDVIEHVNDDLLVLRNFNSALKSGGIIFITVPANKKLWSGTDELANHKRRYDATELEEKLGLEGFRIVRISYFMTFLYPVLFIKRMWVNQVSGKGKVKTSNELKINRLLNGLFYHIFKLESHLLNYVNLPFGSSLICVAQKRRD